MNKKQDNKKGAHFWVNKTINILSFLIVCSFISSYFLNGMDFNKATIFGYKLEFVEGGSMLPTIDNQYIISKVVSPEEIKVGDVIVYYKYLKKEDKEIGIIHRVVEVFPDSTIKTQGDGNDTEDPFFIYPHEVRREALYKIGWLSIEPIKSKPRHLLGLD